MQPFLFIRNYFPQRHLMISYCHPATNTATSNVSTNNAICNKMYYNKAECQILFSGILNALNPTAPTDYLGLNGEMGRAISSAASLNDITRVLACISHHQSCSAVEKACENSLLGDSMGSEPGQTCRLNWNGSVFDAAVFAGVLGLSLY
jgi:hypothetical protein